MKPLPALHIGSNAYQTALYRVFILPHLTHLRRVQLINHIRYASSAALDEDDQPVRRALPQLTRLTPLPMNREIQHTHQTILFKSSKPGAPQPRFTREVLTELDKSNRLLHGTDMEQFLVEMIASQAQAGGLPLCGLFTRKQLRDKRDRAEKAERVQAKREKGGKEIDVNWTIEDRDLDIVLGKLGEFLKKRISVAFSIVQPRRCAPVAEPRMEEILARVEESAKSFLKGKDAMTRDGELGKMLTLNFKLAAQGGGRMDERIIHLEMPLSLTMLEAKLADMKAALKKGLQTTVHIIEAGEQFSKKWLPKQEISRRVRTTARGVRGVVEDDATGEPNVLVFLAEYSGSKLPRILELSPDLSMKMLDVRGQWIAEWLLEKRPVQLFLPLAERINLNDVRLRRLKEIVGETTSRHLELEVSKEHPSVDGITIKPSLGNDIIKKAEPHITNTGSPLDRLLQTSGDQQKGNQSHRQRTSQISWPPRQQRPPSNQQRPPPPSRQNLDDAMNKLLDAIK